MQGKVVFRGRAGFGAGAKLAVGRGATLTFGDQFLMTARSELACFKEISFGDNCLLSWNILVMDTDAHPVYDEDGTHINDDQPITIGNKVWIGCRSTILKGTVVADGCIIGAGALLNKKFSNKNCIIAGNPVRIVKENVWW